MSTRLTARLGAAALAIALAAGPALAQNSDTDTAPARPMTHGRMHHAPMRGTSRGAQPTGDQMIEQLNAKSLAAAQAGQTFVPPGASGNAAGMGSGSAPAMTPMHNDNM
ncbi:MAG: hypothetical protein JOZ42_13240 [Acetobacteraceae bacterium]|nr:hypothetical protein [Acetobacteraceae bacterium]